jgi:hypothetical protein
MVSPHMERSSAEFHIGEESVLYFITIKGQGMYNFTIAFFARG